MLLLKNHPIILITYLFLLVISLNYRGSAHNTKIDSLKTLLESLPKDTAYVRICNTLSWEYRNTNPDSGIYYGKISLDLIGPPGSPAGGSALHASAYSFLASNYLAKGDFPEAVKFYSRSMEIRSRNLNKAKEDGNERAIYESKKGIASVKNNLGIIFWQQGSYAKALLNFKQSLHLYKVIGERSAIISSIIGNIGSIYHSQGDYEPALKLYFIALKIRQKLDDKRGIAHAYNNIGNVYWSQGMLPLALDYLLKGLKTAEETGDLAIMASANGNIGLVYSQQNSPAEALGYFLKCLEIQEMMSDKHGMAGSFNNIGSIYWDMDSVATARNYYLKSLSVCTELNDSFGIAQALNNLGSVFTAEKNFARGMEYQEQALKIYKNIGDKKGISYALDDIGELFINKGEPLNAIPFLNQSLSLCIELGLIPERVNTYYLLFAADSATGNIAGAFDHYKLYIQWKDSLINEENTKRIVRLESKYEWDKKETRIKTENEKERVIAVAESRRQKIIILFTVVALLFTLFIALLVYRNFVRTKKFNRVITFQKEIIEKQKQDITDSIEYAGNIQRAMLPSIEEMKLSLSDFFILYLPKAIVSGDFYWIAQPPQPPEGGKLANAPALSADSQLPPSGGRGAVLLAVCDCTGHGVPGAFMSMLCNALLNESVSDKGIKSPELIFEEVRRGIVTALKQKGRIGETKDGMDAVLISLHPDSYREGNGQENTGTVNHPVPAVHCQLVCANNPLYLIRNGTLTEFKPDRFPVGIYEGEIKPFALQEVELQKGDMLYAFSDGYEDQLGGEKQKKFKSDKLKNLLVSISDKNTEDQKRLLEKTFREWKGENEQTDDVTLIGIRI
ncbi:MAG: tetratricopeptide repeat protein [Bacteroidetes bacterium]|nr:tetratricopeptide repeat protein [Bacteroidota bacterium]